MEEEQSTKTHGIIVAILLALLHTWNSVQVCLAIADAPGHRFDAPVFAYVLLAIPFALVSLLALLDVIELMGILPRVYFKKAALITLLVTASIVPLLFALVIDSGSGSGFTFTLIVIGAIIFGIVRIARKDNEETTASAPKPSWKLLVFALLIWLCSVTLVALAVNIPALPVSFYLGLLVSFIVMLLVLQVATPKYPKAIYILWLWIAVAAYILISSITRDEWWKNGVHIERHFDKTEEYTLRNGRKVDIETQTYPNGDTAMVHNHNPVEPGVVYFQQWDKDGRRTYYQYDSIINGERVPIQYDVSYFESGYVRSIDKHFFIEPVLNGRRVYYYVTGEKNVDIIYGSNNQVKGYRYDRESSVPIDSIMAYPPYEWYAK